MRWRPKNSIDPQGIWELVDRDGTVLLEVPMVHEYAGFIPETKEEL